MRAWAEKKLALGLCVRCGRNPHIPDRKLCKMCLEKSALQARARRNSYKRLKRCTTCGEPITTSHVRCEKCSKLQSTHIRRFKAEKIKSGYCRQCPEKQFSGQVCEYHWYDRMARSNTDDATSEQVKQLLIKQGFKCTYSGKILIPGENASIDHILPISRGGTKTLDNIQWVDLAVNYMKRGQTHEEFIETTKQICHYTQK